MNLWSQKHFLLSFSSFNISVFGGEILLNYKQSTLISLCSLIFIHSMVYSRLSVKHVADTLPGPRDSVSQKQPYIWIWMLLRAFYATTSPTQKTAICLNLNVFESFLCNHLSYLLFLCISTCTNDNQNSILGRFPKFFSLYFL